VTYAHRETATFHSRRQLGAVLVLTGSVMLVEAAGAWWTGSLALAADAGHMLTDVGAVGLALFAAWIAARPPTPAKTYGYFRVEILAALVNALVLLVVAGWILFEAWERFQSPREILGGPMLVIGALGLVANLISARLLHRGAGASLNVRAVYLEVVSDALASVGVVIAAVVVTLGGWTPIDPLVSAGIALFIVPRTWRLLTQAVNILLEGVPSHLRLEEVEDAMRDVIGVRRVHDLHVWTLTSGREAMSAHVVVDDPGQSDRLLDELHAVLHARFGIDHTTIQIERDPALVRRIKGLDAL
jgi:cobalt-zinc-cadmium efflux system protein